MTSQHRAALAMGNVRVREAWPQARMPAAPTGGSRGMLSHVFGGDGPHALAGQYRARGPGVLACLASVRVFLARARFRAVAAARKAIFCAASQRFALTRQPPGSTYRHSCDIFRMVAGQHARHASGMCPACVRHVPNVYRGMHAARPHPLRGVCPYGWRSGNFHGGKAALTGRAGKHEGVFHA